MSEQLPPGWEHGVYKPNLYRAFKSRDELEVALGEARSLGELAKPWRAVDAEEPE